MRTADVTIFAAVFAFVVTFAVIIVLVLAVVAVVAVAVIVVFVIVFAAAVVFIAVIIFVAIKLCFVFAVVAGYLRGGWNWFVEIDHRSSIDWFVPARLVPETKEY